VHLTLQRSAQEAVVALSCVAAPDREPISPESPYGVAAQILETLGLDWRRIDDRGSVRIALHIPLSQQRTILVVDDNEGLLALFRRYLRNQPYLVCTARDGEEVQAILAQTRPDVTILDIMLPNQDGWEILQLLRSRVAPHQTRVIICSIINDPELAQALGADAFLHKPVPRAQLLRTLNQVLVSVA